MAHEPATVDPPTVSGPVPGSPANRLPPSIAEQWDYVEEEFFLSGEAVAWRPSGTPPDATWSVEEASRSTYRTRVLVRRPSEWADHDGTIVLEWLNVSAGVDTDAGFGLLHPVLLERRQVWVGVSTQQIGVGGGGAALHDLDGAAAGSMESLKVRDPVRYATLVHPGDIYSYSIFAQAAAAVRSGGLTGGRLPARLIATGQSQSAYHLVTFANAVQPLTGSFDGFLIHSRAAGAAPLTELVVPDDQDRIELLRDIGNPVAIRPDVGAPVFQFETETDLVLLGFIAARQADTSSLVTWEVAGTAHADATILAYAMLANEVEFDMSSLCEHINEGPQAAVLRAAFSALCDWVGEGIAPPTAPPIETDSHGRILRDGDGNSLGGVRTPAVDAPWATHSGISGSDSPFCQLFGSTVPLSESRLTELYPDHGDYLAAVDESAREALDRGFLLAADHDSIVETADSAPVPR